MKIKSIIAPILVAFLTVSSARAAAIVTVYLTLTPPTVIDVESGTLLNGNGTLLIPEDTPEVYASILVEANGGGLITLDTGVFTVTRSGAATVGLVSFIGGIYPGTSPRYGLFDANGNNISPTGQTVKNSTGDSFVAAAFKITLPTVDSPGEQVSFGTTIGLFQNGAQINLTGSANGVIVPVPEPNTAVLTTSMLLGFAGLRRVRCRRVVI